MKKQLLAAVVLTGISAWQAHATFFQNTTGIASPQSTVTFAEHVIAQDAPITTQYSDVGVTFNGVYSSLVYTFPNVVIPQAANFINAGFTFPVHVNPFSIHFNTVQTGAAVALISNGGANSWEALLNNVVVDSGSGFQNNSDLTPDFYGFTGISFDEIRITINNTDGLATFDTIQMSNAAVPEPSTYLAGSLLVLVFGMQGISYLRKRKQVS